MYVTRIFEIQKELMVTQLVHLQTVLCKALKPVDYSF